MNRIIDYKPRQRRRSKTTLHTETQKVVRSLIITLTSMIIVLSGLFLYLTNENAQKGYALEQEKLRNESLKSVNNAVNAKINQDTSYNGIEESDLLKEMTTPEQKTFVSEEDNKVK